MPRSAAQRAARRRRRLAKRGMLGPVLIPVKQVQRGGSRKGNPPAPRKRNRANRKANRRNRQGEISSRGKVNALNSLATDGINSSRVIVNNSTIEDTFQVRREKVANINGSSAFTIAQQLYINPGNSILFPIFSQIAATYEEYRINVLEFTYETEAYTASGSTLGAGKVIQVTNFDPDDANFVSDTQAENYAGAVRGPPYASTCHDVLEAHKLKGRGGTMRDFSLNNYFVYSSANGLSPLTGAGKFYDAGNYQLITQGNAASTEMGELYVTYSFTMIRPKQQTPLGQNLTCAHYASQASAAAAATPMSGMAAISTSNFSPTFTSTTCVIPAAFSGRLQINALWTTGNNNIAAVPTVSASAGATLVSNYSAGGLFSSLAHFLAAGTTAQISFCVDCLGGGTLTFGGLTGMTGADCDIHISQISSGLALLNEDDSRDSKRVDRLCEQVEMLTRRLALLSPCESPTEQKEADLDKSVYISRSEVKKLPSGFLASLRA